MITFYSQERRKSVYIYLFKNPQKLRSSLDGEPKNKRKEKESGLILLFLLFYGWKLA